MDRCETCGALPARRVVVRDVTGWVLPFRVRRYERVVCRSCGTALSRWATDRTLTSGWWGVPAVFVTIWALLGNRRASQEVAALGEPSDWQRPEGPDSPGRPVRSRRGVMVTGVGFFLLGVAALFAVVDSDGSYIDVDDLPEQCIVFREGERFGFEEVDCDGPHDARVIRVEDEQEDCPAETVEYLQLDMVTGPDRWACLAAGRG